MAQSQRLRFWVGVNMKKFLFLVCLMLLAVSPCYANTEIYNDNGVRYEVISNTLYTQNNYVAAMFKVSLPASMKYEDAIGLIGLPKGHLMAERDTEHSGLKFREFLYEIAYSYDKLQTLGITAYDLEDGNVKAVARYAYPYNMRFWNTPDTAPGRAITNWFRAKTVPVK